MSEMNGAGVLRRVLEDARQERRCSKTDLTVLSPQADPYRLDTPAGHRDGRWAAEQLERAIGAHRRIHWRGLHYAIVAAGDIRKPSGEIYRNTEEDWTWLTDTAGKAGRWLGYIDFERITDNRNSAPLIYRKARVSPEPWVSIGIDVTIPEADDLTPYVGVTGFEGRQPYALSIFGEKTSLEEILLRIAQRFEADLYLPAGEISDTLLFRMAKDGAADGRPMIVFVVADCDPAGHQMSVSIGRKLQALRDLLFPGLEFQVRPVALTVEQVRELGLPSTPLKETEKRADKWREAFGVEQTEIDALATLRPQVLERIVSDAISPFYDRTLESRVLEARAEWKSAAQEMLEDQLDADLLASLQDHAADRLAALAAEIDAINEQLRMASDGRFELPAVEVPDPETDPDLTRQGFLVSSDQSWTEGTLALKSHKAYGDGGGA